MNDDASLIEQYRKLVEHTTGADRTWAYHNLMLVKQGYFSSDELIDMSLRKGFSLENPLTRIRRGTQIDQGAIILNGTTIDGAEVTIGANSRLSGAMISGSRLKIGQSNTISGEISVDNLTFGDNNLVHEVTGTNPKGNISFGNGNKVRGIKIVNQHEGEIVIGDFNELHPGLSISCPFPLGWIRIGHHNNLGRDGGGVISSSYRFNHKWGGPVVIGSNVETTRGAEVLGFAALGLSVEDLIQFGRNEAEIQELFRHGRIPQLLDFFSRLLEVDLREDASDAKISLFGTAKVRRGCLVGVVKMRDDARVQASYLKNVWVDDRCQIYFSAISPKIEITINQPGCVIENQAIEGMMRWDTFPTKFTASDYSETDYSDFDTLMHTTYTKGFTLKTSSN